MKNEHVWREELNISGSSLVSTIKELIHEGDIRRIIIKDEQGKTLVEIPLLIGAVVALALPVVAAIGAIGAIANHLTIVIEREASNHEDSTEEACIERIPINESTDPAITKSRHSEQLETQLEEETLVEEWAVRFP